MAANTLTRVQKREWAQILFTKEGISQREIAQKTGVSEKTIGDWKEKYGWEKMRKSLLVTKEEQIRRLYDIIDGLTQLINESDTKGDTKKANMLIQYTAALNNLETETSLAQIIDVGQKFLNFIRRDDLAKAKEITALFDAFIQSQI